MGSDGRVIVKRLQLDGKYLLSGNGDGHYNDGWLRLFNIHNSDYYGGFAAGELWTARGSLSGSDIRLKDHIKDVSQETCDKLMQLEPKTYVYKAKPEEQRYGLIAQEVQSILPELVCTGPEGIKGIQYNDMIPLLLLQIKQLRKEVDELKRKIH
jgi:hypothetical protein